MKGKKKNFVFIKNELSNVFEIILSSNHLVAKLSKDRKAVTV
jgi:hypothetical protein